MTKQRDEEKENFMPAGDRLYVYRVGDMDPIGTYQRLKPPEKKAGQSCGVCGLKGAIKLLYPRAVKAFEPACKWHDEQYRKVDWTVGTLEIDQEFFHKCLIIAGDDIELQKAAHVFFKAARRWGQMRYGLAKFGVCWSMETEEEKA